MRSQSAATKNAMPDDVTPPLPTRSLSAAYGAGASAHDEHTLQAWQKSWHEAISASKDKQWADVVEILENCVSMRPDFAKGYVPLSRAYRALHHDTEAVNVLHRGLKNCAFQGSAESVLAELRRVSAAAEEAVDDAAGAASSSSGAAEPPLAARESSLKRAAAESLCAAGFVRDGYAWRHEGTGTLVIESDGCSEPEVYHKALIQADVDEYTRLAFASGAWDGFGVRLVRWIKSAIVLDRADGQQQHDDDDEAEEADESGAVDVGLERLPTPDQLGADVSRALTIYTWGDKVVSKVHLEQETGCTRHFNAKPLDGRGGGADLKVNATQDPRIVRNVSSSMLRGEGAEWLKAVVREIERSDEHQVSIFCSQGRHRSVSAALILKTRYYPAASFVPLKMR